MNAALLEHQRLFANLHSIQGDVENGLAILHSCIKRGNKILLCGNGGSAADCQHFAAELVGRWKAPRPPLPAIALTTDTSTLTAIANDFGYERVFARQVRALGNSGDVLIAISTSMQSLNVLAAITAALERNMPVVVLTGMAYDFKSFDIACIRVPSTSTPRIQEAHEFILHYWAEELDKLA